MQGHVAFLKETRKGELHVVIAYDVRRYRDANGVYDNSGYTLRGHQFTDANGRYQLTTVVPGIYTGRTEHIHVKVQAPNGKLITSQLFFPGVTENDGDGIFDESLLMSIQDTSDGMQGEFNFVVPAS